VLVYPQILHADLVVEVAGLLYSNIGRDRDGNLSVQLWDKKHSLDKPSEHLELWEGGGDPANNNIVIYVDECERKW
jgi:hypothetical protein